MPQISYLYHDHSVSSKDPSTSSSSDTLQQSLSKFLDQSIDSEDPSMEHILQHIPFSQKDDMDIRLPTMPKTFEQDSMEHSSSDLSPYPHEYRYLDSQFDLDAHPFIDSSANSSQESTDVLDASLLCPYFPEGYQLNPQFTEVYQLEDELGSGGYGFVMTAVHRTDRYEVAVKFIIKSKVPEYAWVEHEALGKMPTEVLLLGFVDHENIVKGLDLFEDDNYYYLVQELHGSPWRERKQNSQRCVSSQSDYPATPDLSPSVSTTSLSSLRADSSPDMLLTPLNTPDATQETRHHIPKSPIIQRPEYHKRPSHDLFEFIEQSEHQRLSEKQAKYVFAQVVDAVYYLDKNGIAHRDIKDENIVIDQDLRVKLIDFGSASCVDPDEPRPYYTLFYGTNAYASPEIRLKQEYQAAPAEIWTLGILLSYILTGSSPFPTLEDAINGRLVIEDLPTLRLSRASMSLMRRCLDPDPRTRATIAEVRAHRWLK